MCQTTYTDNKTPLTYEELVAMAQRIPEPCYTFQIPDLEEELDLRDYFLDEYEGLYVLVRKDDPPGPQGEISMPRYMGAIGFHPAHFIEMRGLTPNMAEQLVDVYPSLRKLQ